MYDSTFALPSGAVDHETWSAALGHVVLAEEAPVRVDAVLGQTLTVVGVLLAFVHI